MKKALLVVAAPTIIPAVLLILLGSMLFIGLTDESANAGESLGENPCLTVGPVGKLADLDPEQSENAGTIVQVGASLNVPTRGLVVAIATAIQESQLRNLDYGDRDSLGLFQQRPSSGWGTADQIRTPELSARAFYGRAEHTQNPGLLDIPGWETMELWEAAQAVQRSGFPTAYAAHEPRATAIVQAVLENSGSTQTVACGTNAMSCPATGLDMEDGLTPDALIVARCTVQEFGITNLLGVGERAANSASDHPSGRAVDVMIDNYTSAQGRARGDEVAEWVRVNAPRMGVKYVIWNARIWSADRAGDGWRTYAHPSGASDDNSLHKNHVHVSVYGNAAVAPTGVAGAWTLPLASYTLTARFGDCSALWSSCHTGLDFAAGTGTSILAAAGGTVTYASWGGAYGNLTKIDHGGGVETWYAHQTAQRVNVGDKVAAGTVIGTVGATGNVTGPHLHFEVRDSDQAVDPESWLRAHGLNP